MIRLFDILLSFFGLLILLPFFLIIASIIKLDSSGPIFFTQLRVGRWNADFYLFKFRTMRPNAEKLGQLTVGGKDPRITEIGYVLRKYKLDELPQLINVFLGHMSLVGPRPEVRKYVSLYSKDQRKVLSVKPGVTDYASIEYSDENEILGGADDPEKLYIEKVMVEKLELNQKFISNPDLASYFTVILLTVKKIIG
ncbi:MAG: glycosyl transferase [Crocinitomicaceae bacterium]|nr:glycosyl transferase [Crocinitomicaceae bacterium]|tara:strand:- start:12378 stop:12965 length:588 start_codon:yes stop_codon:yes gene_type:complete